MNALLPSPQCNDFAYRHIVIMGVSGSGKSTVGEMLSPVVGLAYRDGDDLHPQENIAKMARGVPLTDEDRWPWLREIGAWLAAADNGAMVGCSALKRSYRDLIREYVPEVAFLHLDGEFSVLFERMNHRPGHFMPASLLHSQVETLESLGPDESGKLFDISEPLETIVGKAARWIRTGDQLSEH
ncbi:gluconokinase [Corynebacterium incognita]|uniref:Gluconokinase n=1 Tax=Corynebacterium incognita TaxID=2754725 RepID=A0A7G7CRE8_9CORY|nr:gluconokinase [Corynebacterium incognita]QNE90164.1 gluconokinase [Corynebacterium incognita]